MIIKMKDILLEKKDLDSKKIKTISKMVDRNNHTEARLMLAQMLVNSKLVKYYTAILQLNDVFWGKTPPELSKLNAKMEKELYRQLVRTYSNYEEIYKAL